MRGIHAALAALAIIAALLAASALTAPHAQRPDTIEVGAILALSGNAAVYGEWAQRSLELAADEINAEGGINGTPVDIVYEDGKFNTTETVNAFHKLKNADGVDYVLSMGSSPSLSISPLANRTRTVQMDFSATTELYRSKGDYTFRTAPRAEQFGRDAAAWLLENGHDRAAALYINNDQGHSIYPAFEEAFEAGGGTVTGAEPFDQDGTDFRTVISKALPNDSDYVFLIGHLAESGRIVRQMNELGYANPILSHVYSVEGSVFLDNAGDYQNDLVYLAPAYDPKKSAKTRAYDAAYRERYGEPSEYFGTFAYDALHVMVHAIRQCDDPADTACVRDRLFEVEGFDGLTGDITFDAYGDRVVDLSLKTVTGGRFVPFDG